jgi:hypothetical protein
MDKGEGCAHKLATILAVIAAVAILAAAGSYMTGSLSSAWSQASIAAETTNQVKIREEGATARTYIHETEETKRASIFANRDMHLSDNTVSIAWVSDVWSTVAKGFMLAVLLIVVAGLIIAIMRLGIGIF